MKNFLISLSTAVCFCSLVGCSSIIDEGKNITTNQETQIEDAKDDILTLTEDELKDYSFEYFDIHFTHSLNENINVSITYPQFKDTKLSELNSTIEDFAKNNFKNLINDSTDDTVTITLEEKYSVSSASTELISISSNGTITNTDSPYPTLTNTALNINPLTLKKYTITDFINIDDEFITNFYTLSSSTENLSEYVSNISSEDLKVQLQNSKAYIKDNQTIILFEVPHAIGDIIEITVE